MNYSDLSSIILNNGCIEEVISVDNKLLSINLFGKDGILENELHLQSNFYVKDFVNAFSIKYTKQANGMPYHLMFNVVPKFSDKTLPDNYKISMKLSYPKLPKESDLFLKSLAFDFAHAVLIFENVVLDSSKSVIFAYQELIIDLLGLNEKV